MDYSNEYVDALENEVNEMRKYEKHAEALLALYSFRRNNEVYHTSTNTKVEGDLSYVLYQLYRVKHNIKKTVNKYEADGPQLIHSEGIPESVSESLFKSRNK